MGRPLPSKNECVKSHVMKTTLIFLFLTLLTSLATAAIEYKISYQGHLLTNLTDMDHAVRRQINHSVGPLANTQGFGYRSAMNLDYTYEVIEKKEVAPGVIRLDYIFHGHLVTEKFVDIKNFKVVVPIQAEETFRLAQFNKNCTMKGYRGDLYMFFTGWSPYFKGCHLIKGESYEEFPLLSYELLNKEVLFKTADLVQNNEFNLFYYYGSDYYSLSKPGHSGSAKAQMERLLRKNGFVQKFDEEETSRIFNKTSREIYSFYNKYTKSINGVTVNAYLLLGNPTDHTPIPKREFYDFYKEAFKRGSYIHYNGHAGVDSTLNFDGLEIEYNDKIEYNQNLKQVLYLDGCNTNFESQPFFKRKKHTKGSLVLFTNGLSILTNVYLPAQLSTFEAFMESFEKNSFIDGNKLVEEIEKRTHRIIQTKHDDPMIHVFAN